MYKLDYFQNKFPYIKSDRGKKKIIVYLQDTVDLVVSIKNSHKKMFDLYSKFTPDSHDFYVLGYDPEWPRNYTLENVADDYANIIKNNIGKCTICGVSFGGYISMILASKYPDLIEKQILIVTAHKTSPESQKRFSNWRKFVKQKQLDKLVIDVSKLFTYKRNQVKYIFKAAMSKKSSPQRLNPSTTLTNSFYESGKFLERDNSEILKNIKCPTLIIGGTNDQLIPKENYVDMDNRIPDSKIDWFKGNHNYPIEKPRKISDKIGNFLQPV